MLLKEVILNKSDSHIFPIALFDYVSSENTLHPNPDDENIPYSDSMLALTAHFGFQLFSNDITHQSYWFVVLKIV